MVSRQRRGSEIQAKSLAPSRKAYHAANKTITSAPTTTFRFFMWYLPRQKLTADDATPVCIAPSTFDHVRVLSESTTLTKSRTQLDR
jgi:hypothetical protein